VLALSWRRAVMRSGPEAGKPAGQYNFLFMAPFFTRLRFAFRTFFSILFGGRVPEDVLARLVSQAAAPPPAAAPAAAPATAPSSAAAAAVSADDDGARAAQMLALLQRDGRLVDFLMEDIGTYADAQIGAAVRDVHAGCRQVLQRYLTLEPVLQQEEGGTVRLDGPIDPAKIKIVGNPGPDAVAGVLRHRGWIARDIDLPQMPSGSRFVIAPAEVDVA
jgi:hypothetical protein